MLSENERLRVVRIGPQLGETFGEASDGCLCYTSPFPEGRDEAAGIGIGHVDNGTCTWGGAYKESTGILGDKPGNEAKG